jgi:hypothetical protein
MHGFPLTFAEHRRRMCRNKKGRFATEASALSFLAKKKDLKGVYHCPVCCMFHVTTHAHKASYDQMKWWLIWEAEIGY